jgi:hypothetical protein
MKQDREAARALDHGADRRAGELADDQIAFPMPRRGPVIGLGRALVDHRHVHQPPAALVPTAVRPAASPSCPQRLRQFAVQAAEFGSVDRLIDRLV